MYITQTALLPGSILILEFVVCVFEACEEIENLQSEMQRLKRLKMDLNHQRDAFITELSQRSGEGPEDVSSVSLSSLIGVENIM